MPVCITILIAPSALVMRLSDIAAGETLEKRTLTPEKSPSVTSDNSTEPVQRTIVASSLKTLTSAETRASVPLSSVPVSL